HRIPRADVAGDLPRVVAPRVDAGLARLRHDVEGPQQLAGFRVEPAHVLRRRLLDLAALARARGVAGDDDNGADDQRSGAVVEAAGERLVILEVQARPPAIAEVRV